MTDPRKRLVRHHISLTFDQHTRDVLDTLAEQYGFRHPNGTPRDAEMIRVLLVGVITEGNEPEVRLAYALYSNSVLDLSGHFAGLVGNLRADIGRMAGRLAETGRIEPEQQPPYEGSGEKWSRNRVYLTVDDWLRANLERMFDRADYAPLLEPPSGGRHVPDLQLVRQMLRSAVIHIDRHRPLVQAYSTTIDAIKDSVARAMATEQARLATLLSRIGQ